MVTRHYPLQLVGHTVPIKLRCKMWGFLRLVMKDDENRRLLHAKVTTLGEGNGAFIELLYPTIYKLSCLLNLRFFPFDVQVYLFSNYKSYNLQKMSNNFIVNMVQSIEFIFVHEI